MGKVKARGVGEKMASVGVTGSSVVVVTSSVAADEGGAGECVFDALEHAQDEWTYFVRCECGMQA